VKLSRRELVIVALVAVLVVAAWLLADSYPSYDAYYHLVWGRELFAGNVPSIGVYQAPTAHPLYIALGGLLAVVFGSEADRVIVLVGLSSLAICAWSLWRIGRVMYGTWPGIVAALLTGSTLTLLIYSARGFVDVPFLAFVFLAAALEAGHRRRGLPVMLLLAAAGLLRPEAWVIAGVYWLWCIWPPDPESGRRSPHLGLLALLIAPPLVWVLFDWWAVGEPLYSLTATSSLAEQLGRPRGLGNVPRTLFDALVWVLRAPVLALAVAGLVLEAIRRRAVSLYVGGGLVVIGIATYALLGVFGLSLIPRYLTVTAVALLIFAAYALAGWVELPRGSLRRGWAAVIAVLVISGLALTAVRGDVSGRADDELGFVTGVHNDLVATLTDPAVVKARRCGPLTLPTFSLVPDSLWIQDSPTGSVISRSDREPSTGVALVFTDFKTHKRYGTAAGIETATDHPPGGFKLIAKHGRISAWALCR
jgi:hypothetical protein